MVVYTHGEFMEMIEKKNKPVKKVEVKKEKKKDGSK